jgi:hypothetical protein
VRDTAARGVEAVRDTVSPVVEKVADRVPVVGKVADSAGLRSPGTTTVST